MIEEKQYRYADKFLLPKHGAERQIPLQKFCWYV